MLNNILESLEQFGSHGLNDLDKANLMSRVDTKYVFHIDRLEELLKAVKHDYTVLEINGRRISRYSSIYFDTENLLFYSQHHQGRTNRHKVRIRHYLDTCEKYLEVKFKNNKGRTIKKRRRLENGETLYSEDCLEFMNSLQVPDYCGLVPSQESNYLRIALASEERGERVTIDINLQSRLVFDGQNTSHTLPDIVIVEIKQNKINRWTPISRAIRALGIRKLRYSKYCMGMVLTSSGNSEVKTNRFKKIFRKVSTISDAIVA